MGVTRRGLLMGAGTCLLAANAKARAMPLSDGAWATMALVDQAGRDFRIGDERTRLTLVTLWANWCPSCLAELASLEALARTVRPDDLVVMLVSHRENWEADQVAARRRGLRFRLAVPSQDNDPGAVRAAMTNPDGSYVVPRSLLFRPGDALAVWSHQGAVPWDKGFFAPFL